VELEADYGHYSVTFSMVGPNNLLGSLFSDTFILYFSRMVTDQEKIQQAKT
jgi:hypothetical protein